MATRTERLILRSFPWLYLSVLAAAAVLGSQWSIWLGAVLVIGCIAVLERFLHNANPFTPWALARDDQLLFDACQLGLAAPRRAYRWVPSDPRCRICLVPFGGVGKLIGIAPSRKNPEFCTDCIESAPIGVHEREVGILFADIRGFTADTEKRPSGETADTLTRFYARASHILTQDDALVEFVGDQVMALYLPDFPRLGERTCEVMIASARRLLGEIELPVGVGIHFGIASVGNVAKGKIKDFTAVGDVVNTAARLQTAAVAGQIVVSDAIYERAKGSCVKAEPVSLSLKGKSEPIRAYVL